MFLWAGHGFTVQLSFRKGWKWTGPKAGSQVALANCNISAGLMNLICFFLWGVGFIMG